MNKIRAFFLAVLVACGAATPSCCFNPAMAQNKLDIPSDVKPVPNFSKEQLKDMDDQVVFGGRGRGDEGLKKLSDEFDSPASSDFGSLIQSITKFVWNTIQLLVVALLVLIGFRAYQRYQNTGSAVPQKGERTLFDVFDEAIVRLKERRDATSSELAEIDKRLPTKEKT